MLRLCCYLSPSASKLLPLPTCRFAKVKFFRVRAFGTAAPIAAEKNGSDTFFAEEDVSWKSLGVSDRLSQSLSSIGFQRPSLVQAACIPNILSGADVVVAAETGSGKTHGYLVPLIDKLSKSGGISGGGLLEREATKSRQLSLVLCPNVMLCEQVVRMANCLCNNSGEPFLKVAAVCGRQIGIHIISSSMPSSSSTGSPSSLPPAAMVKKGEEKQAATSSLLSRLPPILSVLHQTPHPHRASDQELFHTARLIRRRSEEFLYIQLTRFECCVFVRYGTSVTQESQPAQRWLSRPVANPIAETETMKRSRERIGSFCRAMVVWAREIRCCDLVLIELGQCDLGLYTESDHTRKSVGGYSNRATLLGGGDAWSN
ncbi:unnamed protein product [Cuscuta campestris]|uniref:DEAD-box RNA helicase Q domain-containing protein n=1 Tax=Cuscuta campestris TaxID=132261 RepID=A0A484NNV6_9ASTE|nr:unnamed protein product [Cuscuta campestris]